MVIKSNKKKQLTAAVTLAVMGAAWIGLPGQAFAANGGDETQPLQYNTYTQSMKNGGDLHAVEAQKLGINVYVAAYDDSFNNDYATADGKTMTMQAMNVTGITGGSGSGGLHANEDGSAGKIPTQGLNGGSANGIGVYSDNLHNATIQVGNITVNGGVAEFEAGLAAGQNGPTANNATGSGKDGAAGGNGGNAVATVADITGGGNLITGSAIQVEAKGAAGAAGGAGGDGGNGGNGATGGQGGDGGTAALSGGNGAAGGTGGTGGTGGNAAAGGNGGNGGNGGKADAVGIVAENSKLDIIIHSISAEATGGDAGAAGAAGTAGTLGTAGGAGNSGGVGGFGGGINAANGVVGNTTASLGDGDAGDAGAAGTLGTSGGAGATRAVALEFGNNVTANLKTAELTATATAGKGMGANGTSPQTYNGSTAYAYGIKSDGEMRLNISSDVDLAITAEAKDFSEAGYARGMYLWSNNTDRVDLNVAGKLTISGKASGDTNFTDSAGNTYDASATKTDSTATAIFVKKGSVNITADDVELTAETVNSSTHTTNGIHAVNSDVNIQSTNSIFVTAKDDTNVKEKTNAIVLESNSNLNFKTDGSDIVITGGKNSDYALKATDASEATFDAGVAKVLFSGRASVVNGELTLKSDTNVLNTDGRVGDVEVKGTTVRLTDNLTELTVANGVTKLDGTTVYFYDENNLEDKYNNTAAADGSYSDTGVYRTINTKNLWTQGSNTLYMRTNVNGVYGGAANSGDQIDSENNAQNSDVSNGSYTVNVFDQGMRNGYMNVADAAGSGNHLYLDAGTGEVDVNAAKLVLVNNASNNISGVTGTTVTEYDNGIWNYTYEVAAEKNGTDVVLTSIKTAAATQSAAQKTAQDANKIAAGAAVTLFGADETLMERLGDVRNSADDNDGVWAKYVGGKIKVDGIDGDNDFKYNGFAAGYDREVGNNWRIGLAGQYAKGDTTLTGGDGEIKTAAGALYGTWTGDKGHHVDIVAKVGKVDSETSAYGGTIAQKLDGDFGSTAMSFAVEYGYRQQLNDGWFIEPMARASYVRLGSDDYTVTTRDGSMSVTNDSMNSIVLRGGFLLGKQFAQGSNVYLKAAVLHDFDGDINTSIRADGRTAGYSESIGGTGFEYGLGVNHKFNSDSSMYLDVERVSGGDVTKNWGVNVGFRYSF